MTRREPPRLPIDFLERFVAGSEPLAGDLLEEFSRRPSKLWLWWQVLTAIIAARGHSDDEIRPLVLVDLQPVEAIERTRTMDVRPVNLAASPISGVGGLGMVALGLLVTAVAPAAWWVVLAAAVVGAVLGLALIVIQQTRSTWRTWVNAVFGAGLALAISPAAARAQSTTPRNSPVPIDAIQGILDAFRNHDVVGLSPGADHGDARGPAFVLSLVRDRRFAATAIDLVFENANGRFQGVMDRFTSGGDVPYSELRHVWDDTTQPQAGLRTDVPEIDRALREINAALPRGRQHRAILGDPPINWDFVHTKDDFQKWLEQRDTYPAETIQREVLSKGRKALVVYGSGHLQRKQQATNYDMDNELAETVISLLDRAGVKTFVVVGAGDLFIPAIDTSSWPVPSLALVNETTVGAEPVGQGSLSRVAVHGRTVTPLPREQWVNLPLEKQFDAVLYLGPPSTRTAIEMSPAICSDPGYVETRLQRIAMAGLPPSEAKKLRDFCAK